MYSQTSISSLGQKRKQSISNRLSGDLAKGNRTSGNTFKRVPVCKGDKRLTPQKSPTTRCTSRDRDGIKNQRAELSAGSNVFVDAHPRRQFATHAFDDLNSGEGGECEKKEFPGRSNTPSRTYAFTYASKCIPHPDKEHRGGEDAHIISPSYIAVFDGVGGSATPEIDPGRYARDLARLVKTYLSKCNKSVRSPANAVRYAVSKTKEKGASTATVLSLLENRLFGCHIGDSRFIIVRDNRLFFKVKNGYHSFNQPHQVSHLNSKDISVATSVDLKVKLGDVIVAASDGLWDNMYIEHITESVKHFLKIGTTDKIGIHSSKVCMKLVENLVEYLANTASKYSENKTWTSPFSLKARSAGIAFRGGKKDDITIAVAVVQ